MKLCKLICIAFCLIFCSCDKNNNQNSLTLDHPVLEFPAIGGTGIASLANKTDWEIDGLFVTTGSEESKYIPSQSNEKGIIQGEWYTIEHTDNAQQISVTLAENTGESRQLSIIIIAGNQQIDLLARQEAGKSRESVGFSPIWDSFIDNSPENTAIFIGTKYIGVQNWSLVAEPPYIYVGATFPQNSFATTFDAEVKGNKQAVDLTFNFSSPCLSVMENVKGTQYLQKLKEALASDEYKNHMPASRPYIAKLADLKSLSNLESCFSDNKKFANTFEKIARQELTSKNRKSLSVGKVVFQNFTVSMDTPADGLFIDAPSGLDDLVYIRSLTYGATGYFIIASEYSYNDVLMALKSDDTEKRNSIFSKSGIILLTVSSTNQEAEIKLTFQALNEFLNNPFSDQSTYGYPVYCTGYYAKDNRSFTEPSIRR